MMKAICVASLIVAISSIVSAQTDNRKRPAWLSIDTLLARSDVAAIVRVISGETGRNSVIYRAQVLDAIKGCRDGEEVFFGPLASRWINWQYLVFLDSTNAPVSSLLVDSIGPVSRMRTNGRNIYNERPVGRYSIGIRLVPFSVDSGTQYWVDMPFGELWTPSWIPSKKQDDSCANEGIFERRWVHLQMLVSHLDSVVAVLPKTSKSVTDPLWILGPGCVKGSLRPYERRYYSIDSLPTEIARAVDNYVHDRLGDTFPGTIKFSYAVVTDSLGYRRRTPSPAPPVYRVSYFFQDSANGIEGLCAEVALDSRGGIVKDLEFPRMRANPSKRRLVTYDSALTTAQSVGLPNSKRFGSLIYSRELDSIVWVFGWQDPNDITREHYIWVDAHTGKVVKERSETQLR